MSVESHLLRQRAAGKAAAATIGRPTKIVAKLRMLPSVVVQSSITASKRWVDDPNSRKTPQSPHAYPGFSMTVEASIPLSLHREIENRVARRDRHMLLAAAQIAHRIRLNDCPGLKLPKRFTRRSVQSENSPLVGPPEHQPTRGREN